MTYGILSLSKNTPTDQELQSLPLSQRIVPVRTLAWGPVFVHCEANANIQDVFSAACAYFDDMACCYKFHTTNSENQGKFFQPSETAAVVSREHPTCVYAILCLSKSPFRHNENIGNFVQQQYPEDANRRREYHQKLSDEREAKEKQEGPKTEDSGKVRRHTIVTDENGLATCVEIMDQSDKKQQADKLQQTLQGWH